MTNKKQHVRRMYLQAIWPIAFAALIAALYVIFAVGGLIFGSNDWIKSDVFKLCIFILIFYVAFSFFLKLVKKIIMSQNI